MNDFCLLSLGEICLLDVFVGGGLWHDGGSIHNWHDAVRSRVDHDR